MISSLAATLKDFFSKPLLNVSKRHNLRRQKLAGFLPHIEGAINKQRLLAFEKLHRSLVNFGEDHHFDKTAEVFEGDKGHTVALFGGQLLDPGNDTADLDIFFI